MKTRLAWVLGFSSLAAVDALACNGEVLDLGGTIDGGATAPSPDATAASTSTTGTTGNSGYESADAGEPATDADSNTATSTMVGDAACSDDAPATLDLPLVAATDAGDPTSADQETWLGYAENYTFPQSMSDVVKLTLNEPSDGGTLVTGHAEFGTLPLFPPVTDPNVGYPYASSEADPASGTDSEVLEGFAFTLYKGTLVGNRLQGGIDQHEFQAQWCSYQTSFLQPGSVPTYSCLPNGPAFGTADPCIEDLMYECHSYPVNCNRMLFCGLTDDFCSCDATGCKSGVDPNNPPITIDMQINGTHADGSIAFAYDNPTTVHLVKQ